MLNALVLAGTLCSLFSAPATTFYVAKNGDDRWSGALKAPNAARTDGPFASVERARDAIRGLKAGGGLTAPVTVMVRDGTYMLGSTLVFTAEDSGSADGPITYRAMPRETPVLTGGRTVKGWRKYRGGIYVADLAAQGLGDYRFRELFLKGGRQILARFPNFDPAHPVTGGLLYVDDTASESRNGFHYAENQIPFEKWGDISQAEVNIQPYHCWDHNIVRIAKVDPDLGLIRLRHNVMGMIFVRNRYFLQNVFGALDAPGEWFSDWKTGKLYFQPPDGKAPGDGDVTVPVLENIVEFTGAPDKPVQHLSFRGFRLTCARQDAITLEGARNCAITGNTVARVGGIGINVGYLRNAVRGVGLPWRTSGAGKISIHSGDRPLLFGYPCENCRVAGNDIDSVGGEGVALQGTKNVADNNHISRTGTYDRVCAGVTICGDENVASHNVIHDVPRDGIFINGKLNVAEYNDIRNSMLYTADNAAIALRQHDVNQGVRNVGNVLRYNRLLDTIGYGSYPHCTHPGDGFASPFCSFGIYLDGSICGVTVYGNIIARTGGDSVFIQFGGGNIVENNIFVEGDEKRVQFDSMIFFGTFMFPDSAGKYKDSEPPNQIAHNIFYYGGPATTLYQVGSWDGAPDWNRRQATFDDNLIWHKGRPIAVNMHSATVNCKTLADWQGKGYDTRSLAADPLFVDAAHDDYRLRPDSPAYKVGFKNINAEIGKIGAYPSDERASWPLRNAALQREKPLVFDFGKEQVTIVDGFERSAVGTPAARVEYATSGAGTALVSAEAARTGRHSLKFTDAPGMTNPWEPHVCYRLDYATGKVHFAIDVMNSKDKSADYYMEFRDWNYAGSLFVGPTFRVTRDGGFFVNGNLGAGGREIARVPNGEWYNVSIGFTLGDKADGNYTLTLAVPGKPDLVTTLPFGDPRFKHATWFGISSTSTDTTVFYVDNLILGPADSDRVRKAFTYPIIMGTGKAEPSAPATPGNAEMLSGWWKLDEEGMELHDSSGNGLKGEASEGQRAVGDFGRALYLDGSGSGATFPDCPLLKFGTGDFSIEAWLCPTNLSIVSSHPRRRLLQKPGWPASYWVIDLWSDGRVQMEMADQDVHGGTTTSAGTIPEKMWTHVAITVDRANHRTSYYFNGKLDSVMSIPPEFASRLDVDGKPVETGTWQQYVGLLSDLRIYKRLLTAEEISRTCEETKKTHSSAAFTGVSDD
jgi:hypothetical protein